MITIKSAGFGNAAPKGAVMKGNDLLKIGGFMECVAFVELVTMQAPVFDMNSFEAHLVGVRKRGEFQNEIQITIDALVQIGAASPTWAEKMKAELL